MKTLITALLLLTSTQAAYAQINANAQLPICDEGAAEMVVPCRMGKSDSFRAVTDMMFGNRKGFDEIAQKAPGIRNRRTGGFMVDDARASFMSETQTIPEGSTHPIYHSITVYEVLLNDCRGTDACEGGYLWTATETTDSDGYTYESKYDNKLEKTNLSELDPEPVAADEKKPE